MGEKSRFWVAYALMWIAAGLAAVMAVFLTINPASAQAGPLCFPSWDKLKAELDKAGETRRYVG